MLTWKMGIIVPTLQSWMDSKWDNSCKCLSTMPGTLQALNNYKSLLASSTQRTNGEEMHRYANRGYFWVVEFQVSLAFSFIVFLFFQIFYNKYYGIREENPLYKKSIWLIISIYYVQQWMHTRREHHVSQKMSNAFHPCLLEPQFSAAATLLQRSHYSRAQFLGSRPRQCWSPETRPAKCWHNAGLWAAVCCPRGKVCQKRHRHQPVKQAQVLD